MAVHHSLDKIEFSPENIDLFSDQLNGMLPIDLVSLIESRHVEEQKVIFDALSPTKALNTFEYLPVWVQEDLLKDMPPKKVAILLNALAPDDRTKLLENLPTVQKNLLIKYLSPEEKTLALKLLGYPEESVGRLMTPDYIAVKMDWTVRQVLDYIRSKGWDSETINVVYAIDDYGKLIDDFRIRQILLAPLDSLVSDIADYKFTALHVDDSWETAVNTFRKNDRVALPVIDSTETLLGMVTLDDILQVSVESDTEDFQNVGGMSPLAEPYMETPFLMMMRKRAGWLTVLFLGEMLTASAMGYFENEISKAVMLALFIPLIISSGGNSGSQASTLVIRAMALGEVKLKDWFRIMRREIFSGLFLGVVLGIIGFFRVLTWGSYFGSYGEHYLMVAFTICFTLIGVVMWGSIIGALLPLILKRLGFDPAVSSAPFVATIVDVTGLIIYFFDSLCGITWDIIMKSTRLDRNEVLPLLDGFFALADRACNGKETPHSAELDKYVHPEFHMRSNGHLLCKSSSDLLLYLLDHQKKYSKVKITELLEDPVIGGNKVVIRFDVEHTNKAKQMHVTNVIAIVTVDDSRLLQWSEVAHSNAG